MKCILKRKKFMKKEIKMNKVLYLICILCHFLPFCSKFPKEFIKTIKRCIQKITGALKTIIRLVFSVKVPSRAVTSDSPLQETYKCIIPAQRHWIYDNFSFESLFSSKLPDVIIIMAANLIKGSKERGVNLFRDKQVAMEYKKHRGKVGFRTWPLQHASSSSAGVGFKGEWKCVREAWWLQLSVCSCSFIYSFS